MDIEQAAAALRDENALLIDVRDKTAWDEYHADGSLNIPIDELEAKLDDLPRDRKIITTCGGGTRGPRAAKILQEAGFEADSLKGGMRAWREANG